jgi:hypothetical protein
MKIWRLYGSISPKELGYGRNYLGFFRGLFCEHLKNATYTRSTGYTWMGDSFKGQVCLDCGKVLGEMKTY